MNPILLDTVGLIAVWDTADQPSRHNNAAIRR